MAVPDSAASPLVICLFGPFDVRVNGLPLPRLRSRSGLSLLALLVLRHDAAVERAWLAGLLWPERTTSQGLATLRRDLTDLRRALGAAAGRLGSPTQHSLRLLPCKWHERPAVPHPGRGHPERGSPDP
jgi:DNA-binding SARP family transcriptional activator